MIIFFFFFFFGPSRYLAERFKALAEKRCQGRVLFLLEGGYDLKALEESVAETCAGLTSAELPFSTERPENLPGEREAEVDRIVSEAAQIHGG